MAGFPGLHGGAGRLDGMDLSVQGEATLEVTRDMLRKTLASKHAGRIGYATLLVAMTFVVIACSKSRAQLEQEYLSACIMQGEHGASICECAASKAGNELSPAGFELLVVTLQGDEEHATRLRDRAGIVEVMAAGTFMIDGPARCSREVEAK